MNVQMGVELHDKRVLAAAGQFVVDRQGAQVVARDPEQEVALTQHLPHRLPPLPPPIGVGVERLEAELTQTDLIGVAAGTRRHSFTAIVSKDFAQLISQERSPGSCAGAAEQVKRKKDKNALHNRVYWAQDLNVLRISRRITRFGFWLAQNPAQLYSRAASHGPRGGQCRETLGLYEACVHVRTPV